MTFVPGVSGNPGGKLTERIATHALRLSVLDTIRSGKHKGLTKLRRICDVVTKSAMEGEPWAVGIVFDRLEGKAAQVIDASVTHEAGAVFVELLRALNDARSGRELEHLPLIEAVREPADNE
jgi:hypothetical protein